MRRMSLVGKMSKLHYTLFCDDDIEIHDITLEDYLDNGDPATTWQRQEMADRLYRPGQSVAYLDGSHRMLLVRLP